MNGTITIRTGGTRCYNTGWDSIITRTGGTRCLNMGRGWDMMQGLLRMGDENGKRMENYSFPVI